MSVPTHTSSTRWSPRLAFDVALQLLDSASFDLDEILQFHKITEPDLLVIAADPVFQRQVQAYKEEIRDKGLTFRTKARILSDELLKTSWGLIHDVDVSPAVKADLIKSVVRWADLEPKNKEGMTTEGGGVRIVINLGPEQKGLVIESEKAEEVK